MLFFAKAGASSLKNDKGSLRLAGRFGLDDGN